jgi:hypothetical protein
VIKISLIDYFRTMKTDYNVKQSVYNPALDYLEGQVFFKEKMERAREFIKKHGLPEHYMKKDNLQ